MLCPEYMEKLRLRFWTKVDKKGPDDCWLWLAGKGNRGHGVFWTGYTHEYAHRLAKEFTEGPIHEGIAVLHKRTCNNPACVNPNHTYYGTNYQNVQDRKATGPYKSTHGLTAKIYDEELWLINRLLFAGFASHIIAPMFKVSSGYIRKIRCCGGLAFTKGPYNNKGVQK